MANPDIPEDLVLSMVQDTMLDVECPFRRTNLYRIKKRLSMKEERFKVDGCKHIICTKRLHLIESAKQLRRLETRKHDVTFRKS